MKDVILSSMFNTNEHFACFLGLHPSTLCRWRRGRQWTLGARLLRVAARLSWSGWLRILSRGFRLADHGLLDENGEPKPELVEVLAQYGATPARIRGWVRKRFEPAAEMLAVIVWRASRMGSLDWFIETTMKEDEAADGPATEDGEVVMEVVFTDEV